MTISRQQHRLKTWPKFFGPILEGIKTFEVRLNDRNYKVGDLVLLEEWDPKKKYTGRHVVKEIGYILPIFAGLDPKYCVFSLIPPRPETLNYWQLEKKELGKPLYSEVLNE